LELCFYFVVYIRALRRAGRAAAAEFFHAPPPPKFSIGAPNAAATEIFGHRRRKSKHRQL